MKTAIKTLSMALAVVGLGMSARAAATLSIYDGVNPLITVTDNGPGDSILSPGIVYVQTNVGVWYLSIDQAVTKPVLGSTTSPVMSMNIQAYSSAAGSLTFTFSDNGFGPAAGILTATASGQVTSGANSSLSLDVYGDPANVVGATTVHITGLGPAAFTSSSSTYQTSSGNLALGAPYSLTEILSVHASGPANLSLDGNFSIPEPNLLALGVLGIGGWVWRRRSS